MGTLEIALPNTSEIDAKAQANVEHAKGMRVNSQPTYVEAAGWLKGLKSLQKQIDETFDPVLKSMRLALDTAREAKAKHAEPISEAEKIVKGKMLAWDEKCEAERLERERKLQEAAQAKAREEQERRAEEARKAAEEAKASGDAERAAAEAARAAEISAAPVIAEVVTVESKAPKVEGISYRETWSAEVLDLLALVRHVAANPQYIAFLEPSMTPLHAQARSLKGMLSIPGVNATCKMVMSAGRAK